MFASRYTAFLPPALKCIRETLEACADQKRSVESFKFQRLPAYFEPGFLYATYVVLSDHPPIPPLCKWGLEELAWIGLHPHAVTYRDTYFLKASAAESEPLHFHELVHAVQWRVLGPEDFLLLYAAGLAEYGYENSPLEAMAYQHQARFDAGGAPYSVEAEVGAQTLSLLPKKAEPALPRCGLVDSDSRQEITIDQVCAHVGPGWRSLLKNLLFEMSAVGWDGRIAQVKEKMGCLCVYIDQDDREDLEEMILLAGERSTFTCEVCGAAPPRNRHGRATMWRCEACLPR